MYLLQHALRRTSLAAVRAPLLQLRYAAAGGGKKKKKEKEPKIDPDLKFNDLIPELKPIFDDIDTWPAEKFPDWLWLVDKPSEELSPKDGKKYWRKINREKIKKNNEIMKSKF